VIQHRESRAVVSLDRALFSQPELLAASLLARILLLFQNCDFIGRDCCAMLRPDFFIAGAPKCGTTALYTWLRAHPLVFFPKVKEPHYFCSDLVDRPDWTRDKYLQLFANAGPQQRAGEATTWNLYSSCAAERIKSFSPDARIIIMLRNPVDMVHSLHSQLIFDQREDLESFEDALDAEGDRKAGRRPPKDSRISSKMLCYRDVARFSNQVERYLDAFSRDRILVIVFDDLQERLAEVYQRALDFLQVGAVQPAVFEKVNANKVTRSRTIARLVSCPPKPLLSLARVIVPSSQLRHRFRAWLRYSNARYQPRKPIDADLRSELLAEFRPDVERLSELVGRDLTASCDTGQTSAYGAAVPPRLKRLRSATSKLGADAHA